MDVIPIAEARAGLSRLLADFRSDADVEVVYIGAHRKPQAVLMPADRYRQLAGIKSPVPTLDRLRGLSRVIERLAEASRLSDVRVFGSVARGEQTDDSDVDLLVTPGAEATLFDISRFELDMEELLGVSVTAVPDTSLRSDRDARIVREAVPL